jgi:superfamily II DNA or RNA helicase
VNLNFEWSPAQERYTKAGVRWFRSALIQDDLIAGFWVFWKKNVIKLRDRGFSVYKNPNNNQWYINQWAKRKDEFDLASTKKVKRPTIVMESCLVTKPLQDKTGLKEWQPAIAERIVASITKWNAALDGSDTGSGKTYIGTAVARELDMKIGVICPLSVIESWRRVIHNHFKMDHEFIRNYESLRTGKYADIVTWGKVKTKTGYSRPQFIWKCPKDTLLIFDESHRCKGENTKNSKLLRAAKKQGYKILCCSATSAINPLELRALGYTLGLHNDKDFNEWLEQNGCEKGRWGYEFNNDKYILQKLHKDMLLDRGIRITREQIPDFPDCDTQAMAYNVGKDAEISLKNIYTDMKRELAALAKKSDNTDSELVIKLRARQRSEFLKIPLFIELIETSLEDGMSVVVFLNFKASITAVAEKLKTNCIIWGNNVKTERQDNIDRFQNNKSRIIIVQTQSGGTGISLHDINGMYPRMALISPSYSVIDLKQVLGRTHRFGGKTKAIQRIIYVAGTVEEEVCNIIQAKLKNLDIINDGDLSIETTKIFKDLP